jgi:hypothetical protein
MKTFVRSALLVVAALGAGAATASADSIGPDCTSCQGSIYTLTNLGLAPTDLKTSDGTFDTWRIVLSIDTTGYEGTGVRIDEVAIKVASSVDTAKLVSAPGGLSSWTLQAGGLNANGCSGSGSGFECADWIVGSPNGAQVGGILSWTFDVDVASALLTASNAASIKARYVNANDQKVGALVSENITLGPSTSVPEPGILTLLAVGGAFAATRRRRIA